MFYAQINKIKNFLYSLPLSMRLALSTFMVSMLTLIVLSGLLKYVIISGMQEEYQNNLNNHLAEMKEILIDRQTDKSAASQKISDKWIEAELENWPYYTRLITKDKRILGESKNMPFTMREILNIVPIDKEQVRYKKDNSVPYIIVKQSVSNGVNFVGQVEVVRDLRQEEKSENKMDDAFFTVAIFGGIFTVLLTLLISKKTLKPVERMRDRIKKMGVSSLGMRLKQNPWPRELKPIALAFDDLLDELEENFSRLSQFSSDLAHELRTPVHKLMVELDVTLSAQRTPQEYLHTMENMQEAVHRTAKMLEDMLFIARAENKVSALKPVEFDAKTEVFKLTDFLQLLLEEKSLKFDIKVSGKVKADPAMFMRALSNLINNAIRYSPIGGVIEIEGHLRKDSFVISVADSGAGIAAKDLHRLFDRFFKADTARNHNQENKEQNEGGTGLGLAIVKSVMAMHGGKALAQNRLQGGAVFTLIFPK